MTSKLRVQRQRGKGATPMSTNATQYQCNANTLPRFTQFRTPNAILVRAIRGIPLQHTHALTPNFDAACFMRYEADGLFICHPNFYTSTSPP